MQRFIFIMPCNYIKPDETSVPCAVIILFSAFICSLIHNLTKKTVNVVSTVKVSRHSPVYPGVQLQVNAFS